MKQPNQIGLNRTGIATSPRLTAAMLKGMRPPSSSGDAASLLALRKPYLAAPERIGTVPVPTTLRGIASTVMQKLKGDQPGIFLDKLGERAAFERSGTRLYDLLLGKCLGQAQKQELPIESLRTIRNEEAMHFELLCGVISEIGGDPTVMMPGADVNGVIAQGLMQVMADPRVTVVQSLQAILFAELADNEAWSLLATLARDMGLDEVAQKFTATLADEERHLTEIRQLYTQLVREENPCLH